MNVSSLMCILKSVCMGGGGDYLKILGSESFTRWLIWGISAWDGASARELGKIAKFLYPHHLRVHKVQIFLPASRV